MSGPKHPRVAVIGFGYWGQNLVRNFHEIGALECVCESDAAHKADFQSRYPASRIVTSYEEVLSDKNVSGVVIATPAESHSKMVEQALLSGKDVFVEKPLCLSAEKGADLVELAKTKGRVLMVGHLLWYHPAVLKLKQLIDDGELGHIQYIYSTRLNLGKIRKEENILWSFAPHDLSVILGLLGEIPSDIKAQGGNYLQQNVTDVTVSLLSFPSGVKAHIFVSWLHPFKEQKLVVVGDKKMAVFNDVESENKLLLYPHAIEWKKQVPIASKAQAQAIEIGREEPLRQECLHFLEAIEKRSTPRTDGAEALRVLRVLQQCQHALNNEGGGLVSKPSSNGKSYFAHESVVIDPGVEIGAGTSIWNVSHVLRGSKIGSSCKIGQNVVIGPNASVGDNVKIQNNVSVYEGVTLEKNVFCGPSMVFTNVINPRSEIPRMDELKKTLVREGATLGANCTVICGVTIGRYAFVGAGAVVTKEIPDYALVVGNPGRVTGWMCRCGNKLPQKGATVTCPACKTSYKRGKNKIEPVAMKGKKRT